MFWLSVLAPFALAQDPLYTFSPGKTWETEAPEHYEYSSVYFEALTAFLKAHHSTALVVARHGKIIYQYGDTAKVSVIASVRKSVLSMLYGNYVARGKIDLQKTVKEIGLDDKEPFLKIEEGAKLEQLLAGRSGIYIVAGKPDAGQPESLQPRRGTELPGNYFTYNEWDFNAAGTAFEKLTGKNFTTRWRRTWRNRWGWRISTARSRRRSAACLTRCIRYTRCIYRHAIWHGWGN